MCDEMGIKTNDPTTVQQDDVNCISWTDSIRQLQNAKPAGVEYHFVCKGLSQKAINAVCISF